MKRGRPTGLRPTGLRPLALALIGLLWSVAWTTGDAAENPLRETYLALRPKLASSPFGKPIVLDSTEGDNAVGGSVHALLDVPFATSARTLSQPAQWCGVLFLHPNTKLCRARDEGDAAALDLRIGKKYDQPAEEANAIEFTYHVTQQQRDALRVELDADKGPFGTRDYRIVLEAIPIGAAKTFLHLSYAYKYGTVGHLAMETYLGTAGRDKVGFTAVGKSDNGEPQFVRGMRGLIERNTMRYYLAIDAVLHNVSGAERDIAERRLRSWYASAERYPRQLHDMTLDEYLGSKREEYRREHSDVASARP